jgi:tol-pal system protein YbgF
VALQRQALITPDSLRGTTTQLFEIRGTVNQQLARIQSEISIIRQENAQLAQTLAGVRDQLERLSRMGLAVAPAPAAGTPPAGAPVAGSDAIELFQTAVGLFERRSFATARRAFEQVLAQHPNSELAPEAQFKLAEILLAESRQAEALQKFESIPQLYPTAPKVPDALFNVAMIHLEQNNRADARRYLERVVGSYPQSSIAATAQQRLREIGPGR